MDEMVDGSEGRVAALEQRLQGVLQRLSVLEQENEALRLRPVGPLGGGSPATEAEIPTGEGGVSRRRLLLGSVGTAAVGAVAMVAGASPAAASGQGGPWTLGELANSATSPTGLGGSGFDPVLLITNNGTSGNACQFYAHDATNPSAVIHAETNGVGSAGEFVAAKSTNPASALAVSTGGTGSAGSFSVNNTQNAATALSVQTTGTGPAVTASAKGGGNAGFFVANGRNAAMWAQTTGSSNAGFFTAMNTTSIEAALVAQSAGSGPGLRAIGPTTNVTLVPRSGGAPTADTVKHNAGDLVEDSAANLWVCTTAGTPGVWRKLAGPATAGAFHVLPAPVRIYDSRPGTSPSNGPKSPLVANSARSLDLTVNNSGVPAGAVAAMVNLLVVNAAAGGANLTIWAYGAARPGGNSMVWGGAAGGRYSSLALTAVDASAMAQVLCSVSTDIVVDVVGYYR